MNLAKFVTIYKTLMYLQRKIIGKEQNGHSFMAGLIGGYFVFGENNNINQQVIFIKFTVTIYHDSLFLLLKKTFL